MDPRERAKRNPPTGWHKEQRAIADIAANYHNTYTGDELPHPVTINADITVGGNIRVSIDGSFIDLAPHDAQKFADRLMQQSNLAIAMRVADNT